LQSTRNQKSTTRCSLPFWKKTVTEFLEPLVGSTWVEFKCVPT